MEVAIVGNCQAELVQTLFEFIAPDVKVHRLEGVHNAHKGHREKFMRAYESSDIIFSQPISDEYRVDFVSTAFIRSLYNGKVVLFTNFWLNGYDPSFFIYKDNNGSLVNGPIAAAHSRSIIRSFSSGLSVAEAVNRWQSLESLQSDAVSIMKSCLDEIVRRDKENDIKCGDFVIEKYRMEQICFTANHPLCTFLVKLAESMLKHCGIKHNKLNPAALTDIFRYDRIDIAPNPFICDFFEMKFDRPTLYRGRVEGSYDSYSSAVRYYTATELVEAYYKIYESRPGSYWSA